MLKTISILAIAGLVLALAPAAQAEFIAGTGFEGLSTEIGFSVPSGGDYKVVNNAYNMETSPGPDFNGVGDPNPGISAPGTPVTFDTVDLSGFSGVEFSVKINIVNASGYEYTSPGHDGGEAYRIFLDLNDGTLTNTVTVFDSWVSIGDLDNVDTLGIQTYTFSIPDNTVSATASVFWNGRSTSGEGINVDDLSFTGTAVPEPAMTSLLAIGGLGVLLRRRRRS
jgi:hypothetical protein